MRFKWRWWMCLLTPVVLVGFALALFAVGACLVFESVGFWEKV